MTSNVAEEELLLPQLPRFKASRRQRFRLRITE